MDCEATILHARSLAGEWKLLGGQLLLADANGGDTAGPIADRCRVMERVDAHLKRPARLDHAAFVAAIDALLKAHADWQVLTMRVFATGPERPAAPLWWVGGSETPGAYPRPFGAFLHACVCGPDEPDAIVLDAELRVGGAEAATECARYLWELWADKELESGPGDTA